MSKVTDGSYGSLGVPDGADYVVAVESTGPAVKTLLLSDLRQYTNMAQVAGTDAATSMAVNTLYTVDMSAWATADRAYTLPATAAVGDMVGIVVTSGNASYELVITAASGDTLNGVAGGTEWSRVFITNEVVLMRCIVANATWMVVQDGRIPSSGLLFLSTDGDGEAAATWTLPTSVGGAWTTSTNIGMTIDTSTGKITNRRPGKYNIAAAARSKDGLVDQKYYIIAVYVNGVSIGQITEVAPAAQVVACQAAFPNYTLTADKYLQVYFQSQDGGVGVRGPNTYMTHLSVQEQL